MERDRTFPPKVQRWSELKAMGQSAAHYRAAYCEPKEPTAGMRFGTLVHTIGLGHGDYAIFPGERRAGKEWEKFEADNPGKLLVKASEHAEALRVVEAVRNDPAAGPLLDGLYEREIAWDWLGRRCAGRVDILRGDRVIDLKTTQCAEPGWFRRYALRAAYHAQMAWYLDGARACGATPFNATIIAVEVAPPFAVTVFNLSPRAIEDGRKLVRMWMERAIACEAANDWPGYVQSAIELDVAEETGLLIDGEEVAA